MRINRGYGPNVKHEDKTFIENDFAFAISNVFHMMGVKLLHDSRQTALQKLNAIVLSEKTAQNISAALKQPWRKPLPLWANPLWYKAS